MPPRAVRRGRRAARLLDTDEHIMRKCIAWLSRCLGHSAVRLPVAAGWAIVCCVLCAAVPASELRRTAIVRAVEQAGPSVVNIQGEKTVAPAEGPSGPFDTRRVNGMGTGVVIDERGYIITNHHVVEGVRVIQTTLHTGETLVARLIEHDPKTDLAIIKIDPPRPLTVITLGISSDLMPGEPVVAVGNPYGYTHTVTRGIISALHRTVQVSDAQRYEDLIQTDASINPGNSGGPLLNVDGEMIGINVAVRAGAQGIGFAIPVDQVLAVTTNLLSSKRLARTWHGVVPRTGIEPGVHGLVIERLEESSPAVAGGLEAGDVITAVGEKKIARALDFERALLGRPAGEEVKVTIERNGQSLAKSLVLAELPSNPGVRADATWEVLGLRLRPVPAAQFREYHTAYRGGLAIIGVRTDGPAARQGIRQGDILVGMHKWETISQENVTYILNLPELAQLDPIKFYIIRGNETFSGHLPVTMR